MGIFYVFARSIRWMQGWCLLATMCGKLCIPGSCNIVCIIKQYMISPHKYNAFFACRNSYFIAYCHSSVAWTVQLQCTSTVSYMCTDWQRIKRQGASVQLICPICINYAPKLIPIRLAQ